MIKKTFIKNLFLVNPKKIKDSRGFFIETYKKKILKKNKINFDFVQEHHSYSKSKFTLRGLHFQTPPFDQAKLVRVIKGSVVDIALDLRSNSPTYKKYFKVLLSSKNLKQLLIPTGFAHGFLTMESNTELIYKTSNYYSKKNEVGISWSDPELNINWCNKKFKPVLSDKDKENPKLSEIKTDLNWTK